MKIVIFTVEPVDKRALVIVYPLAINNINSKKQISPAPVKNPPKAVNGPNPDTAYFAHVTEFNNIPDQCKVALIVNRR